MLPVAFHALSFVAVPFALPWSVPPLAGPVERSAERPSVAKVVIVIVIVIVIVVTVSSSNSNSDINNSSNRCRQSRQEIPRLRTPGVNTNGAAAKVRKFDRLEEKGVRI